MASAGQERMNGEEFHHKRRTGPVKGDVNMFGDRNLETKPALKKPPEIYSEKPSMRKREPNFARSGTGRFTGSTDNEDSVKTKAESELLDAKNTVKDLTSRIEQSNSRAKEQLEYMEKTRKGEGGWGRSNKNYQFMQVMGELEEVKQELSKLKQEMGSLLEEKRRAEKDAEASKLKERSHSSTVEAIKKEIDEFNEEQVLVELARIEALKEYAAIESLRKKDAEEHTAAMEERRKRINDRTQEIDAAKEIEKELAITTSDVNMLESELKQVKGMGNTIQGNESIKHFEFSSQEGEESNAPELLQSITKEIESAKKELASVREEGFRFMASMDIIRTELKNVSEEAARAKKRDDKADLTIQNLNAKLLRGRAKLEAASSAEEKAKSIVSNLSLTHEQIKTEAEAAKKERALISKDTATLKAEIDKIESEVDLTEEKLQAAIEELKSIKSSEAIALENLKTLIENTMRSRASASQRSSTITISKFEYEYLRGRAAGAEEIADKKVAAAQAWIDAIKASEKEILIRTEIRKKEIRESRLEEEQETKREEQPLPAKKKGESELDSWMKNYENNRVPEKMQHVSMPGKSANKSGKMTPVRRGKLRKSASPAPRGGTPRSASFIVRRKAKVMPNLAKLFSGKINKKNL